MTSPAPVSACLIVKNESGQLESCLKSIRPHVAEIVIVDTGSTDSTPEIAKRYADRFETFTGCNDQDGLIADFAMARQRSMDLATQPWIFWCDGDDEVQGAENIAKIVSRLDSERGGSPALVMFPYEYSHDDLGNVTCLHYRERLVSPKGAFRWRSPVHEVLTPDSPGVGMFQLDDVRIVHRRSRSNKPIEQGRNLRILRNHYKKVGESDVRLLYYLGLEYGNVGDFGNSVKFHKRYVELSGWDDEKFLACLKVADHYQNIGDYENSVQWALKALTVREGWAEAYFSLSKNYYLMAQRGGPEERRNWERSIHFAKTGLSLPPTKTILFVNPAEREYEIHRYLNLALNKVGDVQGALDSVNAALSFRPDDAALAANKRIYEDFLTRGKIRDSIRKLSEIGTIDQPVSDSLNRLISDQRDAAPPAGSQPEALLSGSLLSDIPLGEAPVEIPPKVSVSIIKLLWKQLLNHDEVVGARLLIKAAPWSIRDNPEVVVMGRIVDKMLSHVDDKDEYASFCGRHGRSGQKSESIPLPGEVLKEYSQWPRWDFVRRVAEEVAGGSPVTVLDVGSVDGWMTNRLGMLGHRAFGVDASADYVDLANSKAAEFSTGARHAVAFLPEDGLPGDFPSEFDVVCCFELYEHVPDTVALIRGLSRYVRPGGTLLLATPRGSWLQGKTVSYHEQWNQESPREHIRAPILLDIVRDLSSAGLVFHSGGDSAGSWSSNVPGQATLMVRATRPASPSAVHLSPAPLLPPGPAAPLLPPGRTPLDVVFYVGPGCEPWNPSTMSRAGIGGSETAVVEMAKRLSAMGNSVRVYGDCHGMEGSFDGVRYIHCDKFKDVECDAFITSRRPNAVDDEFNVRTRARLCWVHDIHCGSSLTHRRALRIDRFVVLSQWHRDFFLSHHRCVHPGQVVVTRNGIDLGRFSSVGSAPRNPHRIVYSSSPDRGLDVAIRIMPRVRQIVPDAELHVFYGFRTWEVSAKSSNDKGQLDLIDYLKSSLDKGREFGVHYHGRVNQSELAREFMASGVWAYPTWFAETSCITAMEAQAAGLRIVTSPIAALNETVGPRGRMVPGDWLSQPYHDEFVSSLVDAMVRPEDGDRERNIAYARANFGMDELAAEWDLMLRRTIAEVARDVVPPYKEAV